MELQHRLAALKSRGTLVIGREAKPEGGARPADCAGVHAFWDHVPAWNWADPRSARPGGAEQERPIFERLPAGTSLPQALGRTRLCIFAGAFRSPQLDAAMAAPELPVLVFEPSLRCLREFLASVSDDELERGNVFLFVGDPARFERPLSESLGANLFHLGYPVFFSQARVAAAHPAWLASLAEYMEILFFRQRIYPLEGQALSRSLPLRPLHTGLDYDQTLHLYQNAPLYLASGRIDEARGHFRGATAVCVAAGPALDVQIDWLRRAIARGALVIAVNNALRTLAAHGVRPHLAVINDTSIGSGRSFDGLPDMGRTVLVSHALSAAATPAFSRRMFFGACVPQVFGQRMGLKLHGSVITTALSLARHLGCGRAVLVGLQLAWDSPFTHGYSAGSIHGQVRAAERERTFAWPEFYPVHAASGRRMFTTLNFRDASLWLLDELRDLGLPVVNITADSILHGPGVTVDPDYELEPGPGPSADELLESLPTAPPRADRQATLRWLDAERGMWESVAAGAGAALREDIPESAALRLAETLVKRFDANGVSYVLQRFADFDNAAFHAAFFRGEDTARRLTGARLYLTRLARMAEGLTRVLAGSEAQVRRDGG